MAYSNDTSIDGLSTFTPSNDDLVVGMDNADIGIAKTTTFSAIKTLFNLSGTNTGDETTTTQGALVNGATSKTTPVDADYVGLMDSAASNILKKLSWANVKATLKTYFDTLYANIAGSTSQAFSVSQLEVGNASDTTLSRSAAGVVAVEGVVIPSISSTNTLTNKRITVRTGTTTSSATPTINTDNVDHYLITAQTVDITSFTTNLSGTPTEGQKLLISITGTAARAITWGSSFESSTIALPITTVSTNRLDVGFVWNTVSSKWRCVATA